MKNIIYIIRHAESQHNVGNYEEKSSKKVDLTKNGILQAKRLANSFKKIPINKIYSSDYLRAYKTAKFIANIKKLKIIKSKSIEERHFGKKYKENNLKARMEINEIFKKLTTEEKFNYKYSSDMESAKEGATRLKKFLLKINKQNKNKNIAVICHGNIMRSFLNLINYATFNEVAEGAIKNTGFIKIEIKNNEIKVIKISGIKIINSNRLM